MCKLNYHRFIGVGKEGRMHGVQYCPLCHATSGSLGVYLLQIRGDHCSLLSFTDFWLCGAFVTAHRLSLLAAGSASSPAAARRFSLQGPLLADHGLQGTGCLSRSTQAQQLRPVGLVASQNLPGPGIESISSALAGEFLTTGSLGKSWDHVHAYMLKKRRKIKNE